MKRSGVTDSVFMMAGGYAGKNDPALMKDSGLRLAAILIGLTATGCLLILIPGKRSTLSVFGVNTMTIYLAHSFFLKAVSRIVSRSSPAFLSNDLIVVFVSLALAVLICPLFGNRWVADLYGKILDRIAKLVLIEHPEKKS